MTYILELIEKNIMIIISVFKCWKLSRDMEDILKYIQNKLQNKIYKVWDEKYRVGLTV